MKVKPIFQRVFVEPVRDAPKSKIMYIPFKGFRDRGRVYHAGGNNLQVGDLIKYNLRGTRDLKFGELELISVNIEDTEIVIKEESMAIEPQGDRILVKRKEVKEVLSSGFILPSEAVEVPQEGEVIAVGAGKYAENGTLIPMTVKVGDTILFPKHSGNVVNDQDGKELLILTSEEILATLK